MDKLQSYIRAQRPSVHAATTTTTHEKLQLQPRRDLDRFPDSRRVAFVELVRYPVRLDLRSACRAFRLVLHDDGSSKEVDSGLRSVESAKTIWRNAVSTNHALLAQETSQMARTFSASLSSWRCRFATGCPSSVDASCFELRASNEDIKWLAGRRTIHGGACPLSERSLTPGRRTRTCHSCSSRGPPPAGR